MKKFPVTVIVPHQASREVFFLERCLPSIEACFPEKVIVERGKGSAAEKRNRGAQKARTPYLIFLDDDCVVRRDFIFALYEELGKNFSLGYSYCDYIRVSRTHERRTIKGRPFSFDALRRGNYISPMSLVKRDAFQPFDETLTRFADWDLWLTLASKGIFGVYVPEPLFEAHQVDRGMSDDPPTDEDFRTIQKKHGIQL